MGEWERGDGGGGKWEDEEGGLGGRGVWYRGEEGEWGKGEERCWERGKEEGGWGGEGVHPLNLVYSLMSSFKCT